MADIPQQTLAPDFMARRAAPLRAEVSEWLRRMITSGACLPGSRLVESALARDSGVSRSTIREAIRELEADGFVQILPGRGAVVSTLDADEVSDLYDFRRLLEVFAVEEFTRKASDTQLRGLESRFSELAATADNGTVEQIIQSKQRFYELLFQGAGNVVLAETSMKLRDRIRLVRVRSFKASPSRIHDGVTELRTVMSHIRSGDVDRAKEAYGHHIDMAKRAVMSALF